MTGQVSCADVCYFKEADCNKGRKERNKRQRKCSQSQNLHNNLFHFMLGTFKEAESSVNQWSELKECKYYILLIYTRKKKERKRKNHAATAYKIHKQLHRCGRKSTLVQHSFELMLFFLFVIFPHVLCLLSTSYLHMSHSF